eukprot:12967364-Alexandrium_andersonii.AAC.1
MNRRHDHNVWASVLEKEKWQARRARAPRDGSQVACRAPRVVAEPSVLQAAPEGRINGYA